MEKRSTHSRKPRRYTPPETAAQDSPLLTPDGFNVVEERVLGTVTFGSGALSPIEAAFNLIASRVDSDYEGGRFRFPGSRGGEITVWVEMPIDPTVADTGLPSDLRP